MKIYISGPMTGHADLNFLAFNAVAADLRAHGHTVVNPAEKQCEGNPNMNWADYMRLDIVAMMECDTIIMLPGWAGSRGARLERCIALELGFAVLYAEGAPA